MFLWIFCYSISVFNFLHEQRRLCGVCVWRNVENDKVFRQMRMKMYRFKCYTLLCTCFCLIHSEQCRRTYINFLGSLFFSFSRLFYIINRNGTSLLCFRKSARNMRFYKPSDSFVVVVVFAIVFSFMKKKNVTWNLVDFRRYPFNGTCFKKLVSFFVIKHFNQIAVLCSSVFSVSPTGSTNEMHTDSIFASALFIFNISFFRQRCVLGCTIN